MVEMAIPVPVANGLLLALQKERLNRICEEMP